MRLALEVPRDQVVLVRVSGTVDASSVGVFADTVAACFGAALHVVVDLGAVVALDRTGTGALLELDRAATRRGTQLHVTGVDDPCTPAGMPRHLLRLASDDLLTVDPETGDLLSVP